MDALSEEQYQLSTFTSGISNNDGKISKSDNYPSCYDNITNEALPLSPSEEKPKDDASVERGKWGRQIEFFLSLLGYSVGIGNLIRFPYLCLKNGGGAFLIPFLLAHLLCGIPLFILELLLGQFSGLSPFTLWNFCPLFKGIGYSMAAICAVISVYYNTLIAYCLFYLISSFASLNSELPWQTCRNWWNSERCWNGTSPNDVKNGTSNSSDLSSYTNATGFLLPNGSNMSSVWASEEFWHRRVLGISGGVEEIGYIRWELVLCLITAWVIVFLSLAWGIKWSGKVVYVTATLPYLLLTALLVRGCTLEGSGKGLEFYLYPDFSKLLQFEPWAEASIQMFYSLGPAWGGLITMSSYNPFRHNCMREGIIAPIFDMGTSLYGGLAIFAIIGYMAQLTNLPVNQVAVSGPGLAFVVYPLALAQLPYAPIWAVVFFLTLITLGIDSMFGTFETVISGIFDAWPRLRHYKVIVVGITCTISCLAGLIFCTNGGMYYFQFLDWYAAMATVPLIALLEVVAVIYIYGFRRFSFVDVKLMLGKAPSIFLRVLWIVFTPLVLFLVLCIGLFVLTRQPPNYGTYVYPSFMHYVGLMISISTILPMLITAIYVAATTPANAVITPNADWRPADRSPEIQKEYAALLQQHNMKRRKKLHLSI